MVLDEDLVLYRLEGEVAVLTLNRPERKDAWTILARASELLLSGRTFTTDEASSFGLIHRIVPEGEALPAALEYGADLAANCSPASIKTMKAQPRAAAGEDVLTSIARARAGARRPVVGRLRRGGAQLRRAPAAPVPRTALTS